MPIYLEHIPLIFENLTTFLKSAQQEKQEIVVKQEKGKSHGPWHSLFQFAPYVLTVICPYSIPYNTAHCAPTGCRFTVYCIHLYKISCFVFHFLCLLAPFTSFIRSIKWLTSLQHLKYRAKGAYGVTWKIMRYSKTLSSSGRRGIRFQLGESSPTSAICCNRHQLA